MKRLLPFLLLFTTTTLALAQGRITFENDTLHLVYMTTDTYRLLPPDTGLAGQPVPSFGMLPSGHTLWVDLWAGTSASTLLKLTTTTFSATAGRFGPINVALPPGFPGGTPDYFQVQVYDSIAGSFALADAGTELYYGESSLFTCIPNPGPQYNSIVENTGPAFSGWLPGPVPVPGGMGSIVVQMNPVPEPSVLALAGLGALVLANLRRRQ
jgi:hypothetical protein